jgi:hypothetical protein
VSGLRPRRRSPLSRGRSPDRADGLPHKVLGDHTRPPTHEETPATLPALQTRYGPCPARAQDEQERSRVEGHRDGPATGGWHNPMALLVAARAVCRSCCRTIWRTWCSLGDPARFGQPCMRTNVPPATDQSCPRGADEQAEIPSTWAGWTVTPGATGQPKLAPCPTAVTDKQADAPGRGSDRGRPPPPRQGLGTRRSACGPSAVTPRLTPASSTSSTTRPVEAARPRSTWPARSA